MKIVTKAQLKALSNPSAIFFTNGGIVIDCLNALPIINFSQAIEELKLQVNKIYLDGELFIIHCESDLQIDQQYDRFRLCAIKTLLSELDSLTQQQILRATHWLTWDIKHNYCNKCGSKLDCFPEIMEKKCISCNISFFPNLAPVVIVRVQRGNEILLARSPHFKPGMYGLISGFIDIGETAEDAVHREVKEEVGIELSNLKYFGTQSWPFPGSFMIAYQADYLRGEIIIDKNEIEDAGWFNQSNLPELPLHSSIARNLIDSFWIKR